MTGDGPRGPDRWVCAQEAGEKENGPLAVGAKSTGGNTVRLHPCGDHRAPKAQVHFTVRRTHSGHTMAEAGAGAGVLDPDPEWHALPMAWGSPLVG